MNLLMNALYGDWLGGRIYIFNMACDLLLDPRSRDFNIFVLIEGEWCRSEYEELEKFPNVHLLIKDTSKKANLKRHVRKLINSTFLGKNIDYDLSDGVVERYKIDVIFPLHKYDYKYIEKSICWIPDFQYLHLPHLYSNAALESVTSTSDMVAANHKKLVLSSNDALEDYLDQYPDKGQGVYVVPFASNINLTRVNEVNLYEVISKYGVTKNKYFIVSNQFWQHKNHMIVFEAINKIKKENGISLPIVCTGLMHDSRNLDYINSLQEFIQNNQLQDQLVFTGVINRTEQLVLMKNALAVIQPSLFEGWGTVAEDAKTLGQFVIMSDIPVHNEQKNEKCYLYAKDSVEQLAELMLKFWNGDIKSDRIATTNDCAKQYGSMFYNVIVD